MARAKLLETFSSAERDRAHARLAELIAGPAPLAECRVEDGDEIQGPKDYVPAPVVTRPPDEKESR